MSKIWNTDCKNKIKGNNEWETDFKPPWIPNEEVTQSFWAVNHVTYQEKCINKIGIVLFWIPPEAGLKIRILLKCVH